MIMNNAISAADVREYVSAHLNDVFETMLSMKAEPGAAPATEPFQGEHVSGAVGLAGEGVNGAVYLHMSSPFARQAAAAMLGMAPEELTGIADINDVVAEMTNMLGGGLKSWLSDAGALCVLTTPSVVRGRAFTIKAQPGVELIKLGFTCSDSRGLVEVHLKYR
jgi:chemotaxis protein CheX